MSRLLRLALTRTERRDALVFLFFALVLLPLVPDVRVGPYDAIQPQSLVRLVVALMAVSGTGYVVQKRLGARLGLTLIGLASGIVSSSATIAAMGMRAREEGNWQSAAAGAVASNIATILLYPIILGTVDPRVVTLVALPLSCAGAAAVTSTLVLARISARGAGVKVETGRPFHLWAVLGFAGVVCVISIGAAALQAQIGAAGIVVVSSVAAFVDAHATAGSVAALFRGGSIDPEAAQLAIVAALSANSLTKVVMAASSRHKQFALTVSACVLLVAGSAWLGWWWSQ